MRLDVNVFHESQVEVPDRDDFSDEDNDAVVAAANAQTNYEAALVNYEMAR